MSGLGPWQLAMRDSADKASCAVSNPGRSLRLLAWARWSRAGLRLRPRAELLQRIGSLPGALPSVNPYCLLADYLAHIFPPAAASAAGSA